MRYLSKRPSLRLSSTDDALKRLQTSVDVSRVLTDKSGGNLSFDHRRASDEI